MPNRQLIIEVVANDGSFQKGMARSAHTTKTFSSELSKTTRGALAGSGAFQALGRSLAFASGGFLAVASAGQLVRTSIDVAREAAVVQRQLEAQFKATRREASDYQKQIDETTSSLSALTGLTETDLKAAFTTILRTQPNVNKALRDTATAADLAAARGIKLSDAAKVIAKVEAGNVSILRRNGVQVAKNATIEQALYKVRQVTAGQAAAAATEQAKFNAVLHNSEVIVGSNLLPILNHYLKSGADWLQQMNESGKLQKDVSGDVADFAQALHLVTGSIQSIDDTTGSFVHTLELLVGLKLLSVLRGWTAGMTLFGGSAARAEIEASGLAKTLSFLSGLGEIAIVLSLVPKNKTGQNALDNLPGGPKGFLAQAGHLPIVGGFNTQMAALGLAGHNAIFGKDSGAFGSGTHSLGFGKNLTDQAAKAILSAEARVGALQGASLQTTDTSGRVISPITPPPPGKLFTLGAPTGLTAPGNLDLNHRQVVKNPDGSISTEQSISIGVNGAEVLIPTVFNGKHHTDKEAIDHYFATKQNLGSFASIKDANAYAQRVHDRQGAFYAAGPGGKRNTNAAKLSNKFFDNSIARILQNGGLGSIKQQTASIVLADSLIKARLAKTHDLTRQQTLEDELAQNYSNLKALRDQAVQRRNSWFDSSIARILLRSGLGTIKQQLAGLDQADALLTKQIAVTKDVTRKGNLVDTLLQNQAQAKQLREQQLAGKEFRSIGFSSSGDNVIPLKPRLKREVAATIKDIAGTALDTKAVHRQLAEFQKLLASGLAIPPEVRSKIQSTLDGITADFKKFNNGLGQLFKHQSSGNFVKSFEKAAGLDLTGDQKRILQGLVAVRGKGGSIPGKTSAAFSVHNDVNVAIDGHSVTKAVTTRQIRRSKKRTIPRGA